MLRSDLILELLESFEELQLACGSFISAARSDHALPLLLPTYEGSKEHSREAAIRAMTRLWHPDVGESLVTSGLLCAGPETIRMTKTLNAAKDRFKNSVCAIRDQSQKYKTRVQTLIDRILHEEGRRNEALQDALKVSRLNRLDLVRCYTHVRILPAHLRSISWTWATMHSTINRISLQEAVAMADELRDPEGRETALGLLRGLPPNTPLAYKKINANQLRANLVWYEEGKPQSKQVTISGVVLSQEATLPRTVWRDDPAKLPPEQRQDRVARLDTSIEDQPFIRPLRLYRYTTDEHLRR